MSDLFIPAKTAEKLHMEHPKGTRHKAMLDIAISLIGNGLSETAVFTQLRNQFGGTDISDLEIGNVVSWASNKRPSPSGFSPGRPDRPPSRTPAPPPDKKRTPQEHARWWLGTLEMTQERFSALSPTLLPETKQDRLNRLLDALYAETESLNIVCAYTEHEGKASPSGAGKTLTREGWKEWVGRDGIPQSKAGAWMRPNPTKPSGSGSGGAITDDDITDYRFLLVESDELPIEIQLALFSKFKLPIAAVLLSGGKSVHAWVRIACKDKDSYAATAKRVLGSLVQFGFDPINKNASRLSRLAGASRQIGALNSGEQTLLWLNDVPQAFGEKELVLFESHLELPLIEEKPLKQVLSDASTRYEEIFQNRGRLGIATGIAEFDHDSGGLKNGQMTIIAAETGIGKTTLAMNMVNAALHAGVGVAMFSMEMDRDEICDQLVAMNCGVNRNVFNTGNFSEQDVQKITAMTHQLSEMPLWIFDEPVQTTSQIRSRTFQLSEENKIGLVVIDYIQFTSVMDTRDSREQQIAGISRAIRSLAKEAKKPVVALSQLNDEGKLRESRVIAHDAHTVILLEGDMQDGEMKMRVVKGRSIPKKEYKLIAEARYCRLRSAPLIQTNGQPTRSGCID
jgi:archaellum biogenesis ATPase FlaH